MSNYRPTEPNPNLQQAIATIDRLVLQLPDDEFPPPHHYHLIEASVAVIQQAIEAGATNGYGRQMLTDCLLTAKMTLGLARAGGSQTIATVMADENASMFNWLEEIMVS